MNVGRPRGQGTIDYTLGLMSIKSMDLIEPTLGKLSWLEAYTTPVTFL